MTVACIGRAWTLKANDGFSSADSHSFAVPERIAFLFNSISLGTRAASMHVNAIYVMPGASHQCISVAPRGCLWVGLLVVLQSLGQILLTSQLPVRTWEESTKSGTAMHNCCVLKKREVQCKEMACATYEIK